MAAANEKLVAARLHKRWSIAVASEKAGVSINTFNRWERGLQIPQLSTLDQVCKAFDLSPEELGFERAISARRRDKTQPADAPASCAHMSPREHVAFAINNTVEIIPRQANELHVCIEQVGRRFESMDQAQHRYGYEEGFSRRRALAALVGSPIAALGLAQETNIARLHPEEILALASSNMPVSWQMYFEGGPAQAELHLYSYLPQLTKLAQQTSPHQKRAAALASQGHQLASLAVLQHQNFGAAHQYAQDAFTYGALAESPSLQTTSLIRQAQVYLYLKRPLNKLQIYERALAYLPQTSPLLQGRVYVGLAETHGHLGNTQQVAHYLGLAHTVFPVQFAADPHYYYTHFNHWSLAAMEGMAHIHLERPTIAWDVFTTVEKHIPLSPVPNRVELTLRQARAAYAMDERDIACTYVQAAAELALTEGSQLFYDGAYRVYQDMLLKWKDDHNVKELTGFFTN